VKLHIEKVVYGGSGLARSNDGTTVFVPFTLPGENVETGNIALKAGRHEADLLRVLDPSPARVKPLCEHFGECGGCSYQHAAYEEQLTLKESILRESLERSGLVGLPTITAHASGPWQYRNRIRLRLAECDGVLRVGYMRRSSAELLPITMCPISAPLLLRAAEAVLQLGGEAKNWLRNIMEIELLANADQTKLQMMFFATRDQKNGFLSLCETVQQGIPELTGAGIQVQQSIGHNRKSLRTTPGSTWGTEGLIYRAAGEDYWVDRGAFFQVNRFLVDELVKLVTQERSGSIAWDLFAGVGLFSRVLAKKFAKVVAVEASAGTLERTFSGKGRIAINKTTVEFLRAAVLQRDTPELVVMDPPRAGAGAEVCSLLMRIKPSEIVYVSCDPITLGRDLKTMIDSGYRLAELHMVDLFPQTFHQETVAVLKQ
jgi:23S rRNA (uracil1939-C5)-methyltransferase